MPLLCGCTSLSSPSGHTGTMGKPALYFRGVTAPITQLSSSFSIFKHAKIASVPQSSLGIQAPRTTGNLLCQFQLCASSKPSQSMLSPQSRKKKATSIVLCQLP